MNYKPLRNAIYQVWTCKYAQAATSKGPVKTRGVSHRGLAIHIKKYLKAKEELWKLK
jgi:hypothetical protein